MVCLLVVSLVVKIWDLLVDRLIIVLLRFVMSWLELILWESFLVVVFGMFFLLIVVDKLIEMMLLMVIGWFIVVRVLNWVCNDCSLVLMLFLLILIGFIEIVSVFRFGRLIFGWMLILVVNCRFWLYFFLVILMLGWLSGWIFDLVIVCLYWLGSVLLMI